MKSRIFEQKIGAIRDRLNRTLTLPGQQALLVRTLQELSLALEELKVIGEELGQQNEELANAHQVIAIERLHYQELFNFSPDGYLVTDFKGVIREVSRTAEALFKLKHGFLVGKPMVVLVAREDRKNFLAHLALLKNEQEVKTFELLLKPQRGMPFHAAVTMSTRGDSEGKGVELWWTIHEITERKRAEAGLQQFAAIVESSDDGIISISLEGIISSWNRGAEKIYGYFAEQITGKHVSVLVPPDHGDEVPQYLKRISQGEHIDHFETVRMRKDGGVIDVSLTISPVKDLTGKIVGASVIARDVTLRKQAEERLRRLRDELEMRVKERTTELAEVNEMLRTENEERRQIQERTDATNALLGMFMKKFSRKEYVDGVIKLIQDWSKCRCVGIRLLNEQGYIPYESYIGFSKDFCESENWLSVVHDQCACVRVITGHPDPQDRPMMTQAGSFRCDNTVAFVDKLSKEDQTRFRGVCVKTGFLSVAVIPICYREKMLGVIHLADEREGMVPLKLVGFIESMGLLIGEVVHRFNIEDQMHESEKRLRLLSSQLLTTQEDERKRVAADIHDGLGQCLTAIKFRVDSLFREINGDRARTEVQQGILEIIQEGIDEARRIQMNLRPSTLDDLGILATLSWFTREFQKTYPGVRIDKQIGIEESQVPDVLKTAIYRIVQEALNNVAKYSQADLAHLSLRKVEGGIELRIEDHGQGFDLDEVLSKERARKGLGLASMRERAELSGGSFKIESARGAGTTLRASWPVAS